MADGCDLVKISPSRFRYKNLIIQMYYSDLKKPSKVFILAHGLPDSPLHKEEAAVRMLVEKGFIVISPHYEGTYDSFGKCTIENCVDSILDAIDFVKKGSGISLWDMKTVRWKPKEIILAGGSFGGGVVLVAGAKSKDIKKIVALAPVTDYRIQGRKYLDEGLMEDYHRVQRGWINSWRVKDKKIWIKLDKGLLDMNAIDYADVLKNKNIFIAHGTADRAVDIRQTLLFWQKIKNSKGKHKLLKLDGYEHLGIRGLADKKVFSAVMKWL